MAIRKKLNVKDYILDKINQEEWISNYMIPTEKQLISITGMSKMTVRNAVSTLKAEDILYAVRGRGTFVSPFAKASKFKSLKQQLKANKVSYLPWTKPIPQTLLNRFAEGYNIRENKQVSFLKIYYVKDKPVALTINWLNNEDNHYQPDLIKQGRMSLFEEKRFDKVINLHRMSTATKIDQSILGKEIECLPTTYSFYTYKDNKIMIARITKVLPEYFYAFETLTRK